MAQGYAGDISSREAWQHLSEEANSVLIDVRTKAEWNYVGLPDLSVVGKPLFKIEWQNYPEGARNESFVAQVQAAGITKDQPILLICRSGVRSKSAAILLTSQGWKTCYNVEDGFEGPHDGQRHRGSVAGWKHDGLPWVQA